MTARDKWWILVFILLAIIWLAGWLQLKLVQCPRCKRGRLIESGENEVCDKCGFRQ